jgi:hypothetical protein
MSSRGTRYIVSLWGLALCKHICPYLLTTSDIFSQCSADNHTQTLLASLSPIHLKPHIKSNRHRNTYTYNLQARYFHSSTTSETLDTHHHCYLHHIRRSNIPPIQPSPLPITKQQTCSPSPVSPSQSPATQPSSPTPP